MLDKIRSVSYLQYNSMQFRELEIFILFLLIHRIQNRTKIKSKEVYRFVNY